LSLEVLETRCLLAIYAVSNDNDSGQGSLRQAILDANAHPGRDTVVFDIPGVGVHTIRPTSPLPAVTDALVIDGTTQPGYAGHPLVELDGAMAGAAAVGLTITAGDSTVRGLVINRFGTGIALLGNGGNVVQGNYIGTDATGTDALGNLGDGVLIRDGRNNLIGGTVPGAGNLISGNSDGVYAYGEAQDTTGNAVQGNYISTDVSGTRALGNRQDGVFFDRAPGNLLGGTAPEARNVISGNSRYGVGIGDTLCVFSATDNTVQGNYIGTDVGGTAPLRNGLGVVLYTTRNLVGGPVAGARNVISGNGSGVVLLGENNQVQGN
jgi:hypothetical protein